MAYRSLLLHVVEGKFRVPPADSEAILQEVWLSSLMTLTHVANPKAWLIAAVCNGSRRYWRSRSRMLDIEGTPLESLATEPAADIPALEHELLVARLLSLLRPQERDVLRLHYFEQLTATEIAERLDTTAAYAERLIWKALKAARTLYARLHGAKDDAVVRRAQPLPRAVRLAASGPVENHVAGIEHDGHARTTLHATSAGSTPARRPP